MIRDLVLDAQTAEPAVRQVDLNLPAEQPLRADGKNVADDEHPDHQHRVNRRAAARRVVGCKLSTHPGQIEHGGDLAHKVIAWYHLVEPKLVEKLLLLVLQPPHHRSPPQRIVSERRNHRSQKPSTGFCNKIGPNPDMRACPLLHRYWETSRHRTRLIRASRFMSTRPAIATAACNFSCQNRTCLCRSVPR